MHCTGVILAGGRSRRFGGEPKGLFAVGGLPIVARVAAALRPASDALRVVANDPVIAERIGALLPGVAIDADLRDGGVLAGVHAALSHAAGACLVVAWDMPFVTTGLLAVLRAEGEARDAVCAPASSVPAVVGEPLCTYYPASALAVATTLLERGEHRLGAFLESLPRHVLSRSDLERFGAPEVLLANVNDAGELAEAERIAAGGERREITSPPR